VVDEEAAVARSVEDRFADASPHATLFLVAASCVYFDDTIFGHIVG